MTTEQTITSASAPAAPALNIDEAPSTPQGTAAPAPTPAAPAPVQPPAAPAPAPNIPEPSGDGKLEATGDPGLDLAIEFINGVGIKGNDPAIEAARGGDFTLLEAKLAALGDKAKGYEKFIALGKQAYERHDAAVAAENAKTATLVYEVVGGEANWKAMQAFAREHATDEEKAQLNAAFAAGGLQAKAAAKYLRDTFAAAQAQGKGGYKEPSPAIKPNAPAGAQTAEPLTAKAYAREVQALLSQSKGRDISNTPEYAALQQRRLASKRAGF